MEKSLFEYKVESVRFLLQWEYSHKTIPCAVGLAVDIDIRQKMRLFFIINWYDNLRLTQLDDNIQFPLVLRTYPWMQPQAPALHWLVQVGFGLLQVATQGPQG